jgi:hypothetical protein
VAAHKYKNSWDTWGCVVGCDISSLTPPNTGMWVVCGVVLLVFGEVLAFDRGADSCVLKVAVRAPSSGSMSSMSREGLPRNVEFVAYGHLLWRACCEVGESCRRGRKPLADFLENE